MGLPGGREPVLHASDAGRAGHAAVSYGGILALLGLCDNSPPGDRVREGDDGPTGDSEADAAWENLGRTYDYHRDTFGRDSYDDSGAELIAIVHFCEKPGEQFNYAYWNGDQMVFGEGYAAPLDESPADPGDPSGAQLTGPLTYSRGGGIAGRMDKLVLQPDGNGTVTTKTGERAVELEAPSCSSSRTTSSAPICPASRRTRPPTARSRTPWATASSTTAPR